MKKRILFISTIFILVSLSFTGCTKEEPYIQEEKSSPEVQVGENQGITVNNIDFEEVNVNMLNETIMDEIDWMKIQRGYYYLPAGNGSYFIFISAGEKKSGGYGIKVQSIEDNEGKTIIAVEETEPAASELVTMAITYPFTVIRASGITNNFVIRDQNQVEYEFINPISNEVHVLPEGGASGTMLAVDEGGVDPSQPITGVYQGQIDSTSIEIDVDGTFMAFRTENVQDQLKGLQRGDEVEITFTVSPSDQLEVVQIIKRK